MGYYNPDGTVKTTTVPGTSYTGLYAADGSVNVVVNDATHTGLYHPCGAWRVSSSAGPTRHDGSGALLTNGKPGTR